MGQGTLASIKPGPRVLFTLSRQELEAQSLVRPRYARFIRPFLDVSDHSSALKVLSLLIEGGGSYYLACAHERRGRNEVAYDVSMRIFDRVCKFVYAVDHSRHTADSLTAPDFHGNTKLYKWIRGWGVVYEPSLLPTNTS